MTKKAFQSFAVDGDDGMQIVISEDDLYADDHPVVKAYPKMFGDQAKMADVIVAPTKAAAAARTERFAEVEQATAAPGEKRDVVKPKRKAKKAAAKKAAAPPAPKPFVEPAKVEPTHAITSAGFSGLTPENKPLTP